MNPVSPHLPYHPPSQPFINDHKARRNKRVLFYPCFPAITIIRLQPEDLGAK